MKRLGINEKDWNKMSRTKIDWNSITEHPTVVCSENKCEFETDLNAECLVDHCIKVHEYGKYKCPKTNCEYEGYSKE